MPGYALDLTQHAFVHRVGDLTVYGTWVQTADEDDATEPCLVVVPTFRMIKGAYKPAVVALSSAYRYADPQYLVRAAQRFNAGLGFEDSMTRVHKLAEVIHSRLQFLIEMPPKPTRAVVVADATITDEGGRKRHAELIEHQ